MEIYRFEKKDTDEGTRGTCSCALARLPRIASEICFLSPTNSPTSLLLLPFSFAFSSFKFFLPILSSSRPRHPLFFLLSSSLSQFLLRYLIVFCFRCASLYFLHILSLDEMFTLNLWPVMPWNFLHLHLGFSSIFITILNISIIIIYITLPVTTITSNRCFTQKCNAGLPFAM